MYPMSLAICSLFGFGLDVINKKRLNIFRSKKQTVIINIAIFIMIFLYLFPYIALDKIILLFGKKTIKCAQFLSEYQRIYVYLAQASPTGMARKQ